MLFSLIKYFIHLFVRFFNRPMNIYCEFIPQLLFLFCLFVYLVLLVFHKWVWYGAGGDPASSPSCAPSILITFINMVSVSQPSRFSLPKVYCNLVHTHTHT